MKIRDLVADCNLLRGSGTAVIILSNAFERLKNLQEFEIGNGDGQLLSHRMGKFQSQYHICPTDAVNSEWRRVTGPANWMMALNAIKMGGVQLFAFQYTHRCRLHPDYFSVCSTSFLNEFKATSSLSLRRLRLNIMSPESVSEQILWDTSFVAFLDVFSTLTDLTLNNEGPPGLRTLGRVLPKFPSCPKLERLALLGFDFDPDDLVTLLVTFKRLTELELTDHNNKTASSIFRYAFRLVIKRRQIPLALSRGTIRPTSSFQILCSTSSSPSSRKSNLSS